MSRAATILRRSCRAAASQSVTETSPEPCSYSGVPLRWFSCAEHTTKPGTSTSYLIKAVDQYSPVISVAKSCTFPLSARVDHSGLVTAKYHYNPLLVFSGIPSLSRMYSSDTRPKPESLENATSKVSSIEASKGSTIDFTTAVVKKKELTDAITSRVY